MTPQRNIARVSVRKIEGAGDSERSDALAVEEPLEIRIAFDASCQRAVQPLAVTMRTPGHDFELAAGFLFTEGILKKREELHEITFCMGPNKLQQQFNVLSVRLKPGVAYDPAKHSRSFYTTSSCGVCGKTAIEALRQCGAQRVPPERPVISRDVLRELPARLRAAQPIFERTGGLHGAALFDTSGRIELLREDVGRHNAVDKLIGARFLEGKLPLHDCGLLLSGRVSFELMQKAAMAGVPFVAAVGAPSSLAVELAEELGMTLVGFLREDRFNIYAGAERVRM